MPNAAFITGGSSGIGFHLARKLAAKGHGIALMARDKDKLHRAMRSLKSEFPHIQVVPYPVDVRNAQDLARAVGAALNDLGPPDWAIANAGIAKPGLFRDQDLNSHKAQMDTNYMGALHFTQAVLPHMSRGNLVFVSSGAAFFGIYGYSAYAPSKFAMRGLAEVLRVELAPDITVTMAYPPDTDTPQLAAEAKTKPAATKVITSGGGLWPADKVAEVILRRARRGKFTATPGFQMTALLALHSLIAPILRAWQIRLARKHR